MRGGPVKGKAGWKCTPQPAQPLDRFPPASIASYLELPITCDAHLDLIASLEIQSFDDSCGQTDGETIAPFGYLHGRS
jgi:hypothetical protein